ncbi:hypothetical protein A1F99_066950 [Pyrenophora tritici-repentis]|nr:hypothetical protein A1F99_066950 [Pyrenophora tritici-repentis]
MKHTVLYQTIVTSLPQFLPKSKKPKGSLKRHIVAGRLPPRGSSITCETVPRWKYGVANVPPLRPSIPD